MSDTGNTYEPDEMPSTDDLEEPSTEKEPAEAPQAPEEGEAEPSHEAVGIGVVEQPGDGAT
ncbi:hypothetical protein ACQ143_14020 [Microbacterium sp. MC2]